MDWAVDFVSSVDRVEMKILRETLEAKQKADRGQYGEAARILWELLVQLRHSKNRKWECITMVHMGKVYRALRWSIAQSLLEDALELADQLGLAEVKMMALAELGEMTCQVGKLEESVDLLQRALALVAEGDERSRRTILLDLAVAYEGLGDYQRCREVLLEAVEIGRAINAPELEEDQAHLSRISAAVSVR
jgi:tetratricopeptide (TPR) repeat protein